MNKDELTTKLKKLDFTENDAKVYLELVELGSSPAGEIIKATDLHRNSVYTSLRHLADRNLVNISKEKGKKVYHTSSPEALEFEFEKKADLAEEVSGNISKLLESELQSISIHRGNEEYLNLLQQIIRSMPDGSTKYIIGTGGQDFMDQTMLKIWEDYHDTAHSKDLHIKTLAYEHQREALRKPLREEGIYDVRYLPQELKNPSGIHVYPNADTVLNIIYSDETKPVAAVKIKDSSLVDGYLNLFNQLWEIAEE